MTQPNLIVKSDASTAVASATTWTASSIVENGQAIARGTATDLELVVTGSVSSTVAFVGSVTPLLVGSATSAFSTTTSITPDKGTLAAVTTASWVSHAHYAQLQFAFYRVQYTPTAAGTVSGSAQATYIFSGVQDSLDVSDN